MADLPAPVKVAPLLKLFRYTFLIMGISWGIKRQDILSRREKRIRECQERKKAIRDAKLKEEKAKQSQVDMDELAKAAGL